MTPGNDQSWQRHFLHITDLGERHKQLRAALRRMVKKRVKLHRGRLILPCGCCGAQVMGRFEMHEALIARSGANMSQQYLIFVPQNVIQICSPCHREYQGTKHLLDRALVYLIKTEGAERVAEWWLDVAPRLGRSVGTTPEDFDWEGYLLDLFDVEEDAR
jgi:hypothetical protein